MAILQTVDVADYPWCKEAILVEVRHGMGALRWKVEGVTDSYCGLRAHKQLLLNGTPILQADLPPYETSEGLLAVGYGIEHADCSQLRDISAAMNAPYEGIGRAAQTLKPLLGLLENGFYLLADCDLFPTDGNEHFFWNTPNLMTANLVSGGACTEDYFYVSGIPAFLYPTQGTDRFDAERVEHYRNLTRKRERFPRAVAYFGGSLLSVLLDGHHKATACALDGVDVPCLVIMPCGGVSYERNASKQMIPDRALFGEITLGKPYFSSKQLSSMALEFQETAPQEPVVFETCNLIQREWAAEYVESSRNYPSVADFADGVALGWPQITREHLDEWFSSASDDNVRKLKYAIVYLWCHDRDWAFDVALRCAKAKLAPTLTERAFLTLCNYKNNADVEQVFIDHFVEDTDRNSALNKIAVGYWAD
ncbi:MAG: hypothetical protein LBN10_04020 [Propionibacteriaceae bacterium]|nr:hypothetical protein [Propionibacteriaceae bacterium]